MVVISKTYDLVLWLMPVIERFPKTLRFTLADRLQNELLDILRLLIEARFTRDRRSSLTRANLALEYLRHLIRMAKDLKAMSLGQYEHASRMINEIGSMVGGWAKGRAPAVPQAAVPDPASPSRDPGPGSGPP